MYQCLIRLLRPPSFITQIVGLLIQDEMGKTIEVICREKGLSQATFSKCKSRFDGMSVDGARRMYQLEDENAKLKKLRADAMLDNAALKDLLSKNW